MQLGEPMPAGDAQQVSRAITSVMQAMLKRSDAAMKSVIPSVPHAMFRARQSFTALFSAAHGFPPLCLQRGAAVHDVFGREPRVVGSRRRGRAGVRACVGALDLRVGALDLRVGALDLRVGALDLRVGALDLRVAARRGEPGLRVIDFGVAKVDPDADGPGGGSTSTASPIAGYTAAYAAPEQISRSRTGPWTDVHALALLLVEVLRGARAYAHREGAELLEEILAAERPTPARFGLRVGPWEEILRRALHRSPDARPRTAGAMWGELSESVEEAQRAWELTTIPEASTSSPAVKPPRRALAVFAGIALLAVAVPVGWMRRARPTPATTLVTVARPVTEVPVAQRIRDVSAPPSPPPPATAPRDPAAVVPRPTKALRVVRRAVPARVGDAGPARAVVADEPRVVVE
jgi:hypothetical protein